MKPQKTKKKQIENSPNIYNLFKIIKFQRKVGNFDGDF